MKDERATLEEWLQSPTKPGKQRSVRYAQRRRIVPALHEMIRNTRQSIYEAALAKREKR